MKQIKFLLMGLAGILFGCQQPELLDPNEIGSVKMRTVTFSAGIDAVETKAALDSETGAFSWQSGDLISVLATDGKFYDFILDGEGGSRNGEFVGSIPETASVTTVAAYPRIAANGAENTLLSDGILNYVLPAEWTYAANVSNVPMVATFGEGATEMSFKQVGGVMRFPVKNLPSEATFVVTMNDKTITGEFPVNIAALGESCMVAGTEASELVINYVSDVDGADAEFNVPVPTGVYNKFTVTIKDASGEVLFSKDYVKDNKVERATLLNMQELVLPERAMVISEVWPFFVDARVVFGKHADVTEYAFYIDGATEPVIVAAETLGNKNAALIGGKFSHNSTHTVAVAKVVDGTPVATSKSETVSFTTADVYQMTQNTGTKFVTAGWDDVAVENGSKYENGRWNAAPELPVKDGLTGTQRRGYRVQLLASDKTTVLYDMIPFDGHVNFENAFSTSSWIGKKNGANIMIPTALAFGYLEPSTDYYFRVKTLDEPVTFDNSNGNYDPNNTPYVLTSERGGCGWSELVKLTTDTPYVPGPNEILYEGFNDLMVANDYMNWAPAVVPDVNQQPADWDTYVAGMSEGYQDFLKKGASQRKWTVQTFSEVVRVFELGIQDADYAQKIEMTFNENAGTLKDWVWWSKKASYGLFPVFGAMRIGQSNGTGNNAAILKTPRLDSDKLLSNKGTKCIVSFKMSFSSGAIVPSAIPRSIWIQLYRNAEGGGDSGYSSELQLAYDALCADQYQNVVTVNHIDDANYAHHQQYFNLSCELYLRKGDRVGFLKPTGAGCKGTIVIDDIKIEVVPGAYEQNNFVDDGVGTAPDETNYDAFGLGEFPISYWWNIPAYAYTEADGTYNADKRRALYEDLKASGMNIVLYNGEVDGSVAENLNVMNLCTELGMKFIGGVKQYGEFTDERITAVKEHLASSPTYIGEYVADEPMATAYDQLGDFAKKYRAALPDKEPYINLYPNYASNFGTTGYEAYLEEYIDKIPSKTLSYDYYGLQASGGVTTGYYNNLDIVRSKTLENRMPFWVITQSGVVTGKKQPTEKEQRWSVWSTIAGGSKGISYFCYWTPNNFDEYMIKRDGTKTDMYYYIQKLNADINTVGKKLLPCHADGLMLSNTMYEKLFDNPDGRSNYGPVKKVSAVSEHVAVGCFRDARAAENGENYKGYKVLVVAQSPAKTIQTRLTLDSSVTTITVTQNNTTKTVDLNNLLDVTVDTTNGVNLTYLDGKLTLNIPEGEALLIEF